MTPLSRVLAAVDFSNPARRAFDHALAISRRHGAGLVVVHAVPPDQALNWEARARVALLERLRHKANRANVAVEERVQSGDPAEIILLHARALRPDVIVMGTHRRTGIDRLREGSIAERVAASATVPVLLVPADAKVAAGPPFRHVVVAVDFTPSSDRAIEQALALAREPGDRITLVHVVPGFSGGVPPQYYRFGLAEYERALASAAGRRLDEAARKEPPSVASIDHRVLVGDTTTGISRAVEALGADLLVVGVPKRGVVSRAWNGLTAARLSRVTRVPMLAVPALPRAA